MVSGWHLTWVLLHSSQLPLVLLQMAVQVQLQMTAQAELTLLLVHQDLHHQFGLPHVESSDWIHPTNYQQVWLVPDVDVRHQAFFCLSLQLHVRIG